MSEHFVFLRSYRKVIILTFFILRQTPVRCLMLYLKRGETLTYTIGVTLTCTIGESLTPFEVVSEFENRMNFEDI